MRTHDFAKADGMRHSSHSSPRILIKTQAISTTPASRQLRAKAKQDTAISIKGLQVLHDSHSNTHTHTHTHKHTHAHTHTHTHKHTHTHAHTHGIAHGSESAPDLQCAPAFGNAPPSLSSVQSYARMRLCVMCSVQRSDQAPTHMLPSLASLHPADLLS